MAINMLGIILIYKKILQHCKNKRGKIFFSIRLSCLICHSPCLTNMQQLLFGIQSNTKKSGFVTSLVYKPVKPQNRMEKSWKQYQGYVVFSNLHKTSKTFHMEVQNIINSESHTHTHTYTHTPGNTSISHKSLTGEQQQ